MMFSTGLSAISNTRYLQRSNSAQTRSLQHHSHWEPGALPKRMREIRLDEIGFDVLADTHNVCYALCLQNWQLDEEKESVNLRTLLKFWLKEECTLLFIAAE